MLKITLPGDPDIIRGLKAGDEVFLSGKIYSARDQAHKRLADTLKEGRDLPFPLSGSIVYYMGPSPAPEGSVIGSCGPTTSSRMDPFTPLLLNNGLLGMIGKGKRSGEVIESIKKNGAVYFYAFGGCGALYSEHIKTFKMIAYPDLGPEAVYEMEIDNFPVIVGIDSKGNSIFN